MTLVQGFSRVLEEYPDACLLMAGREGDATGRLSSAVAELGLGDSLHLLGHRDDVTDLYVAADILVFPSLYEGAAGAVLEAMALRLPVVGSETVADVLDGGKLGEIVPRSDPDALAAAVIRLLRDPARRNDLAEAARRKFDRHHKIETVADRTSDLYRSLTARPAGRSGGGTRHR